MPRGRIKAKVITEEIKELSITDEGLIIILELFKLELVPQIKNLFECVQDLKSKMVSDDQKKQSKLRKKLEKIRGVIRGIEAEVVLSKGFMYHMESQDKYTQQLIQSENEQVRKLKLELDDAIEEIFIAD